MYESKTVKIIAKKRTSGVYEWYEYFVTKNGYPVREEVAPDLPRLFETQKDAENYIYRKGLLKSRKTHIRVVFM